VNEDRGKKAKNIFPLRPNFRLEKSPLKRFDGTSFRYRNMGVSLLEGPGDAQAKRAVKQAQKQLKKMDRIHLRTQMRDNVNRDLPRNVPY
jgi:hypothetical protein